MKNRLNKLRLSWSTIIPSLQNLSTSKVEYSFWVTHYIPLSVSIYSTLNSN